MKNQDESKPSQTPKAEKPEIRYFETGKNFNWLTGLPDGKPSPSNSGGMAEHKMPNRNRK